MKLAPRDAPGYLRKPDPDSVGLLIYGADPMRVASARQQVIAALVGPEGEAEMRLTRIAAGELRKDAALLNDATKAQGFFPGPRVVLVEDATETAAPVIADALSDWRKGDAQIIVTTGGLTAKSALRKLFEGHKTALALGLYDDPPGRDEIMTALAAAGLRNVGTDTMAVLTALSRQIEPGDFRQTIEKLGLYKHGDSTPLTPDDIAACAPQSTEADLDDVLAIVADGKTGELGPVLRRLYAQGMTPVTLCIGATRHFRTLHSAASDPGGAASGVGKLRPPAYGPRRDALVRQASTWGRDRLERALGVLTDTDLQLRSAAEVPRPALIERALIRLAMMGQPR